MDGIFNFLLDSPDFDIANKYVLSAGVFYYFIRADSYGLYPIEIENSNIYSLEKSVNIYYE